MAEFRPKPRPTIIPHTEASSAILLRIKALVYGRYVIEEEVWLLAEAIRDLAEQAILDDRAAHRTPQDENRDLLRRLDEWPTRGEAGPLIHWAAAHLRGCIAMHEETP